MQSLFGQTATEEMYSMNDTLHNKGNMSNPKKDNMFYSVFNAFNVLWEQFSKVPSFITNTNYPLSVTVVHNEGIISHEFYKNLSPKKELSNEDNVYIHNPQIKESLNIIESIRHNLCDERKSYIDSIFNENPKDSLRFNSKCTDDKDGNKFDENKLIMKGDVISDMSECNYLVPFQNSDEAEKEELFEYIFPDTDTNRMYEKSNNYNCTDIYDTSIANKEQYSDYVSSDIDDTFVNVEATFSTSGSSIEKIQSVPQTTRLNLLTNMWQKVVVSVTDRFYRIDPDESDMLMKRSCSPKQRRKLNTIAKGRGRGRAKSQLRRSGVSQTRHRKERTKHDLNADIQNELKNWQELEMYDRIQNKDSDCFNLDEDTVDGLDCTQYIIKESINPGKYTFADIQPRKVQKSKSRKNADQRISKFSAKMRCIPECTKNKNTFDQDFIENEYNLQKNTFRPRLISESSIDSEDSYCIVFETGSEETYESDYEDTENSSDVDQISDDEDACRVTECMLPAQKVKFNLNPIVHIMVQWDYAYRAARKGPWEEMARDRERFRGRINCIERVLNPVLTMQHRTHIWKERFAHIK